MANFNTKSTQAAIEYEKDMDKDVNWIYSKKSFSNMNRSLSPEDLAIIGNALRVAIDPKTRHIYQTTLDTLVFEQN